MENMEGNGGPQADDGGKQQLSSEYFCPQINTDWHRLGAKGSEDWKIEKLKIERLKNEICDNQNIFDI